MHRQYHIALAAGGTGGHIFPAEALAGELLRRGCKVFLVTDRRGKDFTDRLPEVANLGISAGPLAGVSLGQRILSIAHLTRGFFEAKALLKRYQIDAVVGFGGYASVPTIFAAGWLKLPIVLHEQNAVVGRANRLLKGQASTIALGLPKTKGLDQVKADIVVTGNPVRPAIRALYHEAYQAPQADGPIELLIVGGSQGARILSQVIPAAITTLPAAIRQRLRVTQQCRAEDIAGVTQVYADCGIPAETQTFFRDIAERLRKAHLVIARAGASTVSELMMAGRPALLIPYRYAADGHQMANAENLGSEGAAWILPEASLTIEMAQDMLLKILPTPATLSVASAAMHRMAMPNAVEHLAEIVSALADARLLRREAA